MPLKKSEGKGKDYQMEWEKKEMSGARKGKTREEELNEKREERESRGTMEGKDYQTGQQKIMKKKRECIRAATVGREEADNAKRRTSEGKRYV